MLSSSLRILASLLLVGVLIMIQPSQVAVAAVVQPPINQPSPKPSPGTPYPVSPKLENQLKVAPIEIVPSLPGISATPNFGGRTWNTWQTDQEMDYITSVEYLSEGDMILIAAIGPGAVLVATGIAFVGPQMATIVGGAGSSAMVGFANGGINGAYTAGALSAGSRFAGAPAWFQTVWGVALGFTELGACRALTQSLCETYFGLPSTVFMPKSGLRSTRMMTPALQPKSYIFGPELLPSLVNKLAAAYGYTDRIGKTSVYGSAYRKGDSVLKVYQYHSAVEIARQANEVKSLSLASGVPGIPRFIRSVTAGELPADLADELQRLGVRSDTNVAIEMSYLPGESIADYLDRGQKVTPAMIDSARKRFYEVYRLTGRGLGDHFKDNGFHGENIRVLPDNTIGYIDFGGEVLANPENLRLEERYMEAIFKWLVMPQ